jgi:CheY-like chemotaxis protein
MGVTMRSLQNNKNLTCNYSNGEFVSTHELNTVLYQENKPNYRRFKNEILSAMCTEVEENMDFIIEDDVEEETQTLQGWKIIIADDDVNVHETTILALSGVKILGRSLEFLHAYSAAEAKKLVHENDDIALILLDVVMETVDAGLKLVNVIRDELNRQDLRIVLRTGQPGYAKDDMMSTYPIDGYTSKSKLTRSLLIDMLTDTLGSQSNNKELPN